MPKIKTKTKLIILQNSQKLFSGQHSPKINIVGSKNSRHWVPWRDWQFWISVSAPCSDHRNKQEQGFNKHSSSRSTSFSEQEVGVRAAGRQEQHGSHERIQWVNSGAHWKVAPSGVRDFHFSQRPALSLLQALRRGNLLVSEGGGCRDHRLYGRAQTVPARRQSHAGSV